MNKVFKEYMESENNIEFNYNKIISKSKNKRNFLNVAAVIMCITIFGVITGTNYAKKQWQVNYKEFSENIPDLRGVEISNENGYTETLNMEYVYKDDIGVKIDRLFMTDDHFEADVNMAFPNDLDINTETFCFNYVVYDENPSEKIYGFHENFAGVKTNKSGIMEEYKKLGTNYNRFDVFAAQYALGGGGRQMISAKRGNIIQKIYMDSKTGFPKSKKIYIKIFNISYYMSEYEENNDIVTENIRLSGDNEWLFEIDVPEKMYNRNTIYLKLENEIPDVKLENFMITEAKLQFNIKLNNEDLCGNFDTLPNHDEERRLINEKIHIADENGTEYYLDSNYSFGLDYIDAKFDINKYDLENHEFFLNLKLDGKEYKEKIIEN